MLNDLLYFVNTYMKDVSFFIFCKYASLLLTFSWYWVSFRFSRKHVFLRPSLTVQHCNCRMKEEIIHTFFIFVTSKETFIVGLVVVVVCVCVVHTTHV